MIAVVSIIAEDVQVLNTLVNTRFTRGHITNIATVRRGRTTATAQVVAVRCECIHVVNPTRNLRQRHVKRFEIITELEACSLRLLWVLWICAGLENKKNIVV